MIPHPLLCLPAQLFENASGKVRPNDIKQGQIGDCYFLSSLSVLAEQEDRIRFLFYREKLNRGTMMRLASNIADKMNEKVNHVLEKNSDTNISLGLFAVRLCIKGHWRQIILSDEFPCIPDIESDMVGKGIKGGPIFSHTAGVCPHGRQPIRVCARSPGR